MCGTRKCRFSLLSRTNLYVHIHCHVIVFIRRVILRHTHGVVTSAGTWYRIRPRRTLCFITHGNERRSLASRAAIRTYFIHHSSPICARMASNAASTITLRTFFMTFGRLSTLCYAVLSAIGRPRKCQNLSNTMRRSIREHQERGDHRLMK